MRYKIRDMKKARQDAKEVIEKKVDKNGINKTQINKSNLTDFKQEYQA